MLNINIQPLNYYFMEKCKLLISEIYSIKEQIFSALYANKNTVTRKNLMQDFKKFTLPKVILNKKPEVTNTNNIIFLKLICKKYNKLLLLRNELLSYKVIIEMARDLQY